MSKQFNIHPEDHDLGTKEIPFDFVAQFNPAASYGQSLETLHNRGGMNWKELFYHVKEEPYKYGASLTREDAKLFVMDKLDEYLKR